MDEMHSPREETHPRTIVFDGTISAGHVISIISMIGAVLIAWSSLDKRVVVLEKDVQYQTAKDAAQDAAIRDGIVKVEALLREMQQSVNQLWEREWRRGPPGLRPENP